MISFYIRGNLEVSKKFLESLKVFRFLDGETLQIITLAVSLGGFESVIEIPSLMSHDSVPVEERKELGITDNFFRLSVGLEAAEDLIADLDQALKKAVRDTLKDTI